MENQSCSSGFFLGHPTLHLLREIQRTMEDKIQLEKFEDRIIFVPMYNDIDWGQAGNEEKVCRSRQMLLRTQEDVQKDVGHSSDQELKKSGTERTLIDQTVCGTR